MTNTNTSCLDALGISYYSTVADGDEYIVTTGTGEGTFAYLALDIASESDRYDALTDDEKESYDYSAEFCGHVSPEDGRDLAISLAATDEERIYRGGVCTRVLSDADYALVRAAVDALTARQVAARGLAAQASA